jgi:hypothetical protein
MMKTSAVLFSAVCFFRELVWEFLWFYDVLLVCSFSSVCPVKHNPNTSYLKLTIRNSTVKKEQRRSTDEEICSLLWKRREKFLLHLIDPTVKIWRRREK